MSGVSIASAATHEADGILRSEMRYRRLFETAQDGIVTVDPRSRTITDANPFIARLLGYSRKELLNKELWQIGLLRDEAASQEAFLELQEKGYIRYENLPLQTKSGVRCEVEFVSNLYDEGGIQVIQCNIRDISSRKRTEQALRRSEAHYRTLFALGPVAVYCCDETGVIQEYNVRAAELWGCRPVPGDCDEKFGDSFKLFRLNGTPMPHAETPVADVLSGKFSSVNDAEVIIERPDGSRITVITNIAPLKDETGKIIGVINCFYDITDRKRADASLREALADLSAAQAASARASAAKDDFLAALSHELRTPLTPVLMAAGALREDLRLPADVREQLGMMERNIALESRLIDDLLDVTMIGRGKLFVRAQPCDAHSLIGLSIDIVREEAVNKHISIRREFTAKHSGLIVDHARFQQVIWNLMRNAVKFTPRGGHIVVRTSDQRSADGSFWLRVEVNDTGVGIAPQLLDRIFLPFEQGAATGLHGFGGLGLGLAIARAVVDLHGGRISAQSKGLAEGSTFTVDMPGAFVPPSSVTDSDTRDAFGPRRAEDVPATTPLRLLVVEDHESTLQAVSRLLRKDGHEVRAVGTVADALKVAAVNTFDFVISDLGLPDGSGNELMEKLRDRHGLRGIAMSGYGAKDDLLRSRAAGFVIHLVKPVPIELLRSTIGLLRSTITTLADVKVPI